MLCCTSSCWISDMSIPFDLKKWLSGFPMCGMENHSLTRLLRRQDLIMSLCKLQNQYHRPPGQNLYHVCCLLSRKSWLSFWPEARWLCLFFFAFSLNLKVLVTHWFLLPVHALPDRKFQGGAIPFSSFVPWQTFKINSFTSTRCTTSTRMELLCRLSLIALL